MYKIIKSSFFNTINPKISCYNDKNNPIFYFSYVFTLRLPKNYLSFAHKNIDTVMI